MPKTLKDYLAAQDEAVLASFLDLDWCICAAISRHALDDLAARRGATVEDLPGYPAPEVAVVRRKGHAELWVQARRRDYESPFLDFARRCCGFDAASVPSGYNVDHLFSKGRVQTATADPDADARLPHATLVRMLLVDASVNKSFGGLMEGAVIGFGNKLRDRRTFTFLQLAKALGIDANPQGGGLSGPNQALNFAHILDEFGKRDLFARLDLSREQVMAALISQAAMVQHARKQR